MSDSSMPWVKLFTEMLDDPKLGRVPETVRWRFCQFLMLAGEKDAEGYLTLTDDQPMSQDDIAWRLRVDVETLESDMRQLENLGLLENTDHGWRIVKFSERQGRPQSEKRAAWRERKARQREASRGPAWDKSDSPENVTRDTRVSPAPREEERRGREEKNSPAPKAARVPPRKIDKPDPLKELAGVFEQEAGISLESIPRNKRGPLYWNPLSLMLKTADGTAADELRTAIAHLRKDGLTISDPNSVLKTFNGLHGAAASKPAHIPSPTPEL